MDLKPIKTKRDYQAALERAEQLWRATAGSTEADALDVLTLLIADYETRHFPIADPDPIQFLEYVMESRGLTSKDLEPYLGSRARVVEVLHRNRVPRRATPDHPSTDPAPLVDAVKLSYASSGRHADLAVA